MWTMGDNLGLVVLVCFITINSVFGELGPEPKKCCTPAQWEADAYKVHLGSAHQFQDYKMQNKFLYDYKNKRWAYNQVHPENPANNTRAVFDHENKIHFVVVGDKCQVAPLQYKMKRYCIPQNATYIGTYHYGPYPGLARWHSWGYELGGFFVRDMIKVSADKKCLPYQDSGFGIVPNQWRWYTGELPCIPWERPDKVRNGECYKSHFKRETTKGGAQCTRHFANINYGNFKMKIKSLDLFEKPDNCEEVQKFTKDLQLPMLVQHLVMRLKY